MLEDKWSDLELCRKEKKEMGAEKKKRIRKPKIRLLAGDREMVNVKVEYREDVQCRVKEEKRG